MPGRGKVVFPASCSGCSGACPGLTARGWRPRAPKLCHRALLPGASLRLCSCPGKPEGSLAGGPRRSHRPRGKVRAGPFHADAGGLCQQPPLICRRRGCLPSGRPGGWGLGGPGDAALELEGPWRGHLLPLRPGGGGGQAPGAQRGRPRVRAAAAHGAPGLGPRDAPPTAVGENRAAPVGPPLRCHGRSGEPWAEEAGGRRPLPAPQSASSEPRAAPPPAGAGAAPERDSPHLPTRQRVCPILRHFFVFYFVSQTTPPSGNCESQGVSNAVVSASRLSQSLRGPRSGAGAGSRGAPSASPSAAGPLA